MDLLSSTEIKDNIKNIFQSFSQADASITRLYGGTGLGLAIAKKLTKMMGGEIGAFSDKGKGSTFWFTAIFEKQAEGSLDEIAPPNNINGKHILVVDDNQKIGKILSERPIVTRHSLADASKYKFSILLVEDEETNQNVFAILLNKMGYRVVIAKNGMEALWALKEGDYDLILMDIQMPVMDGIEATREIRKNEIGINKYIPIIALTAHVLEGSRKDFFAAGMDDYIAKPINKKNLNDIIKKWIN